MKHVTWSGWGAKLEGVGTVNMPDMPHWMQTSTTRWLHGCVFNFNNRNLWYCDQMVRVPFTLPKSVSNNLTVFHDLKECC